MACVSRSNPTALLFIIVFIESFAVLCLAPIKSEYLYLKIAESHNTTKKVVSACGSNTTTDVDVLVAHEVSQWTLLLDVTLFILASVAGMLITSWSDKIGRKIAMAIPVIGSILSNILLALTIRLNWPLASLYLSSATAGIGGYYMTLLMQGNAYLSDITTAENRGIRFVILETSMGIGGGIAGLAGGYWVSAEGFLQPVLCMIALHLCALLLIPLLPDSMKMREMANENGQEEKKRPIVDVRSEGAMKNDEAMNEQIKSLRSSSDASTSSEYGSFTNNNDFVDKTNPGKSYTLRDLMRAVWRVYSSEYSHCEVCHGPLNNATLCRHNPNYAVRCRHGGGRYRGRVWRMWLYLASYDFFMFVIVGTMEFQTIFNLAEPLCFTPILIGLQIALKFAMISLAPFVVLLYKRLFGFSNNTIILSGLIGLVVYTTAMSFATKPYIAFIATCFLLFANTAKPFIQAQMSSLVSEFEQGAAYALLSFSEVITYLVGTVTFLTLYPATVAIYHGFTWLFAAVVGIFPIVLIIIIRVHNQRKSLPLDGENEPLVT